MKFTDVTPGGINGSTSSYSALTFTAPMRIIIHVSDRSMSAMFPVIAAHSHVVVRLGDSSYDLCSGAKTTAGEGVDGKGLLLEL
jgi:hypothetical protein